MTVHSRTFYFSFSSSAYALGSLYHIISIDYFNQINRSLLGLLFRSSFSLFVIHSTFSFSPSFLVKEDRQKYTSSSFSFSATSLLLPPLVPSSTTHSHFLPSKQWSLAWVFQSILGYDSSFEFTNLIFGVNLLSILILISVKQLRER